MSFPQELHLEELMLRYQRNDSEAVSELVTALSPILRKVLAQPEATRFYVDDLLQECWLRIHKARGRYRAGSPVRPWVSAIARHTRCDGFRRLRSAGYFRELAIDESTLHPCQAMPASERLDLTNCLTQLPTAQREALVMLKISGMSLKEVAIATGASVGSVKQKAHRAYKTLRARLAH